MSGKDPLFLSHWNLIDTCLMATTLKRSGEELIEAGSGGGFVDEASGEDDDIGIVMLTDEVGYLGPPHQAGTHALMLVQRHADALAGTADGDAGIDTSRFNGFAQGVTEVGVIATGLTRSAKVAIDDAPLHQILLDKLFKRVASVVAGQTNYFDVHCYILIKPQITQITRILFRLLSSIMFLI